MTESVTTSVTTQSSQVVTPNTNIDYYSEIKGGIWAVALSFIVIWVATSKLRDKLTDMVGRVLTEHIDLVNHVEKVTEDTNKKVTDLVTKVSDIDRKLDRK